MSNSWHWFVIIGTVLSLAVMLWLLFANRTAPGDKTTGHSWDGIEELDNPLPFWWVGMFVLSIIFAVAYLVVFPGLGNIEGIIGWSSASEHDSDRQAHTERFAPLYTRLAALTPEEMKSDREARQVGRRLFLNHCATCHGSTARGAFGFPDLTDGEWIWGGEYAAIRTTIEQGRTAQMPAWGAALGEDGVLAVTHRVLQLAGLEHDPQLAAAGMAHYNSICVACHGTDGKGNAMLGAPDLTNDIWLYGKSVEEVGFTVRNGRAGNMPAHAGILGTEKAAIVAGYVNGLRE
jgi:cytochrome c oxidase cbb3-type subunit III